MLKGLKVRNFAVFAMLKRKLSKSAACPEPSKAPKPAETASHKSEFFPDLSPDREFVQKFLDIQLELNSSLKPLKFRPPVEYVYNPVEYAFRANESYVTKYCRGPKKLLFVGMNPGPFGMCQTGVPFGEVKIVREWLGIEEEVQKPERECPKKPVLGFACPRSEVSGDRLWNVFRKLSESPENFFKSCFVYNYCPIALLNKDGNNLTPSDIKQDARELEELCDEHYFRIIQLLQPEIIVGVGGYAEKRTLVTLKANSCNIKVLRLVHPSPRVVNNQNWAEKAEKFLKDNDLLKFFK